MPLILAKPHLFMCIYRKHLSIRFCYVLLCCGQRAFLPLTFLLPDPPWNPHVRMSKRMSCCLLCVWIDRSVCSVGMLRAVCLLGTWKLVTPCCGRRDIPWKVSGCPLKLSDLDLVVKQPPALFMDPCSHTCTGMKVSILCPLIIEVFS